MHKGDIGLLLDQAKQFEKKYKWLEAIASYKKTSDWMVEKKAFLKAADIYERIAYSYYRAALQAETKRDFKNRITFSVEAYQSMIKLLKKIQTEEPKLIHAKAMVAWTRSLVESDFIKMESLLDKWWNLENKVLAIYQNRGDLLAIGKSCNNLLEGSLHRRLFLSAEEFVERAIVENRLGEKAIKTLLKVGNVYELAKAYYLTAWRYGIISYYYIIKTDNKISNLKAQMQEFAKKWRFYSDKALSLSEKTRDSWLIGWVNNTKTLGMNLQMKPNALFNHIKEVVKHGKIAKDNYLLSVGFWQFTMFNVIFADLEEDPEKRRVKLEKALEWIEEALRRSKIIAFHNGIILSHNYYVACLTNLANLGCSLEEKRKLLKKAVEIGRESFKYASQALSQGQIWLEFALPMATLSQALFLLAQTEIKPKEKKLLLEEALKIREEEVSIQLRVGQSISIESVFSYTGIAFALFELAKINATSKKIELLNKAVLSFEKGLENFRKQFELNLIVHKGTALHYGKLQVAFGGLLTQLYAAKGERKLLDKAINVYKNAAIQFQKAELPTYLAEIEWSIAKLHDIAGYYLEAAENYENAATEYDTSAKRISRLKSFYQDHSFYMRAWSQIERARFYHSIELYDKARNHYEAAAKLHESTERWTYLAPNYSAWAQLEKAENLSRKESPQQAKHTFQKASEKFKKAVESINYGIEKITAEDEKDSVLKLSTTSKLRSMYCQARINIEEAKILERNGEYNRSSKNYLTAIEILKRTMKKMESKTAQEELQLIIILCQAWNQMALAEKRTSSKFYIEAAKLFRQAKDHTHTKRGSLLASGSSSFCRALATGIEFEYTLDASLHAKAIRHIKSAATFYSKAGYQVGSDYAKAVQMLFDAYFFIGVAGRETEMQKKTKYYLMAEKVLLVSAGSFTKARHPEKQAEVQRLLKTVKEEKQLASSLSEVLLAPSITSSTASFLTPTPTYENSVGLERLQHANVQANLIAGTKEVKVGESFCLTVEFVNAGKEPALLTRVEDFVPPDFTVVKKPEIYRLEDSCLNMKGKQLTPLKLVEAKLVLQPAKKGVYQLKPTVHYLDELGQNKSLLLKSVEIKVKEIILSNRVSTGTRELDALLLGGIPEEYVVVLTGSPSDEKEMIIKNFLEAGVKEGQASFYVATEAAGLQNLLQKPSFHFFLCNPKPKGEVPDQPNVYKLRGKTDLNNINIALLKAYRNAEQASNKRACINIVSDVLVDYGVKATRKWISELTTDLVSKGFTVLAVMNPSMHPSDQASAILDLFDGEISVYQTEDPLECKKSIRVRKLRNQDYIKNAICLSKQT